jgi:hypothetical protein
MLSERLVVAGGIEFVLYKVKVFVYFIKFKFIQVMTLYGHQQNTKFFHHCTY